MRIKTFLAMVVAVFLAGCMPAVDHYAQTTPAFTPESYFNGPIKAWGMIQDHTGKIRERFDITMVGTWKGDTGTLEEDFVYYSDGKKQRRVWTIRKIADGQYEGTAGDVVGKAEGKASGAAMRWKYVLQLPVGGNVYDVVLDDWMVLMNDGVLLNRSYIKKFGITVADLTIFMQKQKP
jgi:hypothetical protein